MEVHLGHKLCLDGVAEVTFTKQCTGSGIPGIGVATLYHKILYHAMEKERVELLFLYQFKEIVPVLGCLVIEAQVYYSGRSVHTHLHILLRTAGNKAQQGYNVQKFLHIVFYLLWTKV